MVGYKYLLLIFFVIGIIIFMGFIYTKGITGFVPQILFGFLFRNLLAMGGTQKNINLC